MTGIWLLDVGSRWPPVLASMLLEICGGSIYITGLYTTDLRNRFFDGPDGQAQIEQLIFASNLGNWVPASGFFQDSRFGGPRNTALIAALLTCAGYLGVWAWSAELIAPSFWQIWLCWFLWGHGSGWFDNAAMGTTAQNFPHQRGLSVALIKAFYGLSGSILTCVYNLFFFERTSDFLLFLGIFLAALGAAAAPLLRIVAWEKHREQDSPDRRLYLGIKLILSIAVGLLAASAARVLGAPGHPLNVIVFCAMLVPLTGFGLMLKTPTEGSGEPTISRQAAPQESLSTADALRRPDFWLLFLIVFLSMGSGLVLLNHAGQMVAALGGDQTRTAMLVSLISIANCVGRVMLGLVPDALGDRFSRTFFLLGNTVIMICAQLILAYGSIETLFLGGLITGFAYGGFWTLVPSLVAEFFGTKFFASLYNCLSLAISGASLVFSTWLASRLYEGQAASHPGPSGGCAGSKCYRNTHLLLAASSCLAMLAAAVLNARRRRGADSWPMARMMDVSLAEQ